MSFPTTPTNGQTTTLNGITYTYSSAYNSWTKVAVTATIVIPYATTGTNINGGTAGQLVYQSAPGVTSFAGPGTAGQLLISAGTSSPTYVNTQSFLVGFANTATNIPGGAAGYLVQQIGPGQTSVSATGTVYVGNATAANNLLGGAANQIPYQTGAGATTFSSNLTYNGTTFAVGGASGTTAAAQFTGAIAITNAGGNQYLMIGNQDSLGVNQPAMIRGANGSLAFGTGTSWTSSIGGTFKANMVLNSTGNLTINTPSSGVALTVNASTAANQFWGVNVAATTGNAAGLTLTGNANGVGTAFDLWQDASNNCHIRNYQNGLIDFWTFNSQRMSISATGNVTINATTGGGGVSSFVVNGSATSGNSVMSSFVTTANTSSFTIASSNIPGNYFSTGVPGDTTLRTEYGSLNLGVPDFTTATIRFGAISTEWGRFDGSGNFLIGYTAAQSGAKESINGGLYVGGAVTATNINLGGYTLTMSGNSSLNQVLTTASSPSFTGLTITPSGSNGYLSFSGGDGSHTGFINFFGSNGVRSGYIGYGTNGTVGIDGQITYIAAQHYVQGNVALTNYTGYLYGNGATNISASTTIPGSAISGTVTTAINLNGGTAGSIPYQTGVGATTFLSISSTAGALLTSNGSNAPAYITQVQAIAAGSASNTQATGQTLVVTGGGVGVTGNSYFANNLGVGGTLYITGDLYVDGTQFIVNTNNIATGDKALVLSTGSTSAALAQNAGIYIGASSSTAYASFYYDGSGNWVTGGSGNTYGGLKVSTSTGVYSAATGALQVSGGIGVAGGGFFGGVVTATTFVGALTGTASTATYAANIGGGLAGQLVVQTGGSATSFIPVGQAGQLLIGNGTGNAPIFVNTTTFLVAFANTATNIPGGAAGDLVYQTSNGRTNTINTGSVMVGLATTATTSLTAVSVLNSLTAGTGLYGANFNGSASVTWINNGVLSFSGGTTGLTSVNSTGTITLSGILNIANGGTGANSTASWYAANAATANTALAITNSGTYAVGFAVTAGSLLASNTGTVYVGNAAVANTSTYAANIGGGTAGQLHYQSGASTTGFVGPGSAGQLLVSAGAAAPVYTNTGTIYVGNAATANTALAITNSGTYAVGFAVTAGSLLASNTGTVYVGNAATAGAVAGALTINSSGAGAASGTTFNGSAAITVSYNTIGSPVAATTSGTNYYNSIASADTRSINFNPQDRNAGLYVDFKSNGIDGLTDGGTFHGVLTFRPYGSAADFTGGQTYQIAGTDNVNLWHRNSTSAGVWGPWYKIIDTNNTSTAYVGTANTAFAITNSSTYAVGFATTAGSLLASNTGSIYVGNAAVTPNLYVTTDNASLSTRYLLFNTTGGSSQPVNNSNNLSFVPSTGALSATSFSGAGTGLTGTAGSLTAGAVANSHTAGIGLYGASFNGGANVTWINNGVLGFSGGTTGLTPSSNTTGTITLAGTLVVANGGTGVATLTGIAFGNGTGAFTAATGAQISSALGSTAISGTAGSVANALTAGTGLYASATYNGSAAVTIINNGVISATGGTGVTVSSSTGTVTFSIGQAVATSSNVQFNALGVGAANAATGTIVATGNITAYSSDARLKTNVTLIANPIEKIKAINGYTFDWDQELCEELGFNPEHIHEHGVLAQEIQQVIPDAVVTAPFNKDYLTVHYERIIPLLIESIKDQQKQIDELKSLVNQLLSKLK